MPTNEEIISVLSLAHRDIGEWCQLANRQVNELPPNGPVTPNSRAVPASRNTQEAIGKMMGELSKSTTCNKDFEKWVAETFRPQPMQIGADTQSLIIEPIQKTMLTTQQVAYLVGHLAKWLGDVPLDVVFSEASKQPIPAPPFRRTF